MSGKRDFSRLRQPGRTYEYSDRAGHKADSNAMRAGKYFRPENVKPDRGRRLVVTDALRKLYETTD